MVVHAVSRPTYISGVLIATAQKQVTHAQAAPRLLLHPIMLCVLRSQARWAGACGRKDVRLRGTLRDVRSIRTWLAPAGPRLPCTKP